MSQNTTNNKSILLLAEDDDDDYLLIEKALKKAGVNLELLRVKNGEEALEYLNNSNNNVKEKTSLILLDLNMPKKNGHEVLQAIKTTPALKNIPVVILTTSNSEDDIAKCYQQGANSYLVKPSGYKELVSMVENLKNYWLNTVTLPPKL